MSDESISPELTRKAVDHLREFLGNAVLERWEVRESATARETKYGLYGCINGERMRVEFVLHQAPQRWAPPPGRR